MDIENVISKVRGWLFKHGQPGQSTVKTGTGAGSSDFEDSVNDILDDAGRFVSDTYDKVSKKSEPLIKKSKAYIYDRIFDQYKRDGMPYGDDHEGLRRWVDEREMKLRNSVDDSLNKGKESIEQAMKKVSDFVEEKFDNPPSEATVDGSVKSDESPKNES